MMMLMTIIRLKVITIEMIIIDSYMLVDDSKFGYYS